MFKDIAFYIWCQFVTTCELEKIYFLIPLASKHTFFLQPQVLIMFNTTKCITFQIKFKTRYQKYAHIFK